METTKAAYLAGLFDGEGYISVMRHNKKDHISYIPVIKVASTNREIVMWLKTEFGGSFETRKFKQKNHKMAYAWTFSGKRIAQLLIEIRPFLRIKAKQVDLVLRRIALYDKIGDGHIGMGANFRYPKPIMEEIVSIYNELRSLNYRGLQPERLSEVASQKEDAIV